MTTLSSLNGKMVIAISSRALFNLEEENLVFDKNDDSKYRALQLERMDTIAQPGVGFDLVKKLLLLNSDGVERVEVVILSRNDPVSGLRIFKSLEALNLPIIRGVFTRGRPTWKYLEPLKVDLFLSANEQDVVDALAAGFAAGKVFPATGKPDINPHEIRIALDGDAVIFDDASEAIFQKHGLDQFQSHEAMNSKQPLAEGPFKSFLDALSQLQSQSKHLPVKIRTALITARSAPAHERAIRTLMSWGIDIDEACFLGGLNKTPFLLAWEPDLFFDDNSTHCARAVALNVPTAHVVMGVMNNASAA